MENKSIWKKDAVYRDSEGNEYRFETHDLLRSFKPVVLRNSRTNELTYRSLDGRCFTGSDHSHDIILA